MTIFLSRSMADRVVTLKDVISEIKDKSTRQKLQVTPYELEFLEPHSEDIQKGNHFLN